MNEMKLIKSILRLFGTLLPVYLVSFLMLFFANIMVFAFYRAFLFSWSIMPLAAFGVMALILALIYWGERDTESREIGDNTNKVLSDNDNLIGFLSLFCVAVLAIMPLLVLYLKR